MSKSIEVQARETAEEIVSVFVDDRMKEIPESEGFWDDPYVLGFLLCVSLQLTQARHGDELEPIVAADAALEALGDLSGIGIDDMKDRIGVLQDSGNAEYFKAMTSADKLVRFIGGSTASKMDPVVLAASKKADAMRADGSLDGKDVSEGAALRGVLVSTLFTEVVMERFGLAANA